MCVCVCVCSTAWQMEFLFIASNRAEWGHVGRCPEMRVWWLVDRMLALQHFSDCAILSAVIQIHGTATAPGFQHVYCRS